MNCKDTTSQLENKKYDDFFVFTIAFFALKSRGFIPTEGALRLKVF